ncbi:MAG: extradiol ring-cleavage dioxygenase [Alicyclobacillus sp.]|nr:extradiol ring-cleavage dioxygenase [Alicyclobacillus sp.]
MGSFVFACLTPHGSQIIEELSPSNPNLMAKTRQSMEQLGREMAAANPDAIVVLTPHGLRVEGQFSVSDAYRMFGELQDGGVVRMEKRIDRDLARAITQAATSREIPVAAVGYATADGPMSCLPMDWGVMVPLFFMPDVPVVAICPSRALSYADHLRMGEALRAAVEASGKRIGLIASCDWAHAHQAEGPYGYHPAAAELDAQVVELVKENRLEGVADFDSAFVENAKPDGIWQTLILAGAIPHAERTAELLSYEVPTYFGLLCAAVRPTA